MPWTEITGDIREGEFYVILSEKMTELGKHTPNSLWHKQYLAIAHAAFALKELHDNCQMEPEPDATDDADQWKNT